MSAPPPYSEGAPQYHTPPRDTNGQDPSKAPQVEQPAPPYEGYYGPPPHQYPPHGYPPQGYQVQQLAAVSPAPNTSAAPNPPSGLVQTLLLSGSSLPTARAFPWRHIMTSSIYNCCEASYGGGCGVCCVAFFCPGCVFGTIYSATDQGTWSWGSCCYPCLCGKSRSRIQRLLGVYDEGCCLGCMYHSSIFTSACTLVQEFRAMTAWVLAGKPDAEAVPPALVMSRTYI